VHRSGSACVPDRNRSEPLTKPLNLPHWRTALLTVGGVAGVGLILSAVVFVESGRKVFSDTRRAETAAAVARMDTAQAQANAARALAQQRSYKGF